LALLNHSYVSQIKSVDVLKAFIARIDEINPITNCVVDERFLEALKEAQEADELVASGAMTEKELSEKKPFLGVPISTKDCIRVEGLLNTSGLYHRKNFRAEEDSQVMKQMREAGAIPFALTNVTELCFWWETVNCVHGRTLNPYDTNRSVGGSSGGEGAIQTSAGAPFGIGADIAGSIRMPAFFNGIFGHRPTRFAISNEGTHPPFYDENQDSMNSIGPMARYAVDLLPMMKVMAAKEKLSELRLDKPVDVKKLRIFYQEEIFNGKFVSPVSICRFKVRSRPSFIILHSRLTKKFKLHSGK
jgi:fatty acid amide hydrolase 2